MIAEEVQKHFEVKVNPRTIEKKAERSAATNVAPTQNDEISTTKPELEKLEKIQHGGVRFGLFHFRKQYIAIRYRKFIR